MIELLSLQCSQIFDDGILKLKKATNIDYKRKAGSKADFSASPWDDDANDPVTALIAGAKFIRENANVSATTFDVIMDGDVLEAMNNKRYIPS